MNDVLLFVLLVVIGYLIGSIPSAYLSMRFFTGKDIRTIGTRSATVTAVIIHGGKLPGAVGLLGEIVKAIICVYLAIWISGESLINNPWSALIAREALVEEVWPVLVMLVTASLASSYSIWLKGNGGQGQTIMVTGLILLKPILVLIIGACYILPFAITRRHLLSNHIFHVAIPISLWIFNGSWEWGLAGFLFVLPAVIKQFTVGDEVVHAKKQAV